VRGKRPHRLPDHDRRRRHDRDRGRLVRPDQRVRRDGVLHEDVRGPEGSRNTRPGDGARYHGRGFIQLTGRANYAKYGQLLGVPLEDDLDLALTAPVAAGILALYFKDHGLAAVARKGDWEGVRRGVNGGLNGWDRFSGLVQALEKAAAAKGTALVRGVFSPDVVRLKGLLGIRGGGPGLDAATTAAVKAFQKAHGIQPTGKVGQPTWDALALAKRKPMPKPNAT
jgi:Putative peptidoglycan binding domain